MYKKFTSYFIPIEKHNDAKIFREYNLVVNILIITAFFSLSYAKLSALISFTEGTKILLSNFFIDTALLFVIRKKVSISIVTDCYLFFGVSAVTVCIYYSGGFISPCLPWLATSPIVALLISNRATGFSWVVINTGLVIAFGTLSHNLYGFPVHYDANMAYILFLSCNTGLVLIIFFIALVFVNGKNSALKKLEESSILLAEEKRKIALHHVSQEIHDNIGAILSVVKLNLYGLDKTEEKNFQSKIKDITDLITKAISDLRQISHNLYTENPVNFNLTEAVKNEFVLLSKTGNYKTRFVVEGTYHKIDSQTEIVIFRMLQETINNIIKHAQAKSIDCIISYTEKILSIKITDDGIGFTCKTGKYDGQGIKSMYDRIKTIGGKLEIDSKIGCGTSINILFSLSKENKEKTHKV